MVREVPLSQAKVYVQLALKYCSAEHKQTDNMLHRPPSHTQTHTYQMSGV